MKLTPEQLKEIQSKLQAILEPLALEYGVNLETVVWNEEKQIVQAGNACPVCALYVLADFLDRTETNHFNHEEVKVH